MSPHVHHNALILYYMPLALILQFSLFQAASPKPKQAEGVKPQESKPTITCLPPSCTHRTHRAAHRPRGLAGVLCARRMRAGDAGCMPALESLVK
jgi:hypothetical protein